MVLYVIRRLGYASHVLVWIMNLVAVLLSMGILTVTGILFCDMIVYFVSLSSSVQTLIIGRLGRSSMGYGSRRSSVSSQDSHGLYSSRQGMGYGGGMCYDTSHLFIFYIFIDVQYVLTDTLLEEGKRLLHLIGLWFYFYCGLAGSYGGSDVDGMYSSSYSSDYLSRGGDV